MLSLKMVLGMLKNLQQDLVRDDKIDKLDKRLEKIEKNIEKLENK